MPIQRSEAPDPEEFVREQLAEHVGHDISDMDEKTIITGTVVGQILEALEIKIKTGKERYISYIQFGGGYSLKQCIGFVRDRINSQCPNPNKTGRSTG